MFRGTLGRQSDTEQPTPTEQSRCGAGRSTVAAGVQWQGQVAKGVHLLVQIVQLGRGQAQVRDLRPVSYTHLTLPTKA